MNNVRMWNLITAGFIVAALLIAVPTQSKALAPEQARSSAGSSSTGATDAASAAGPAAVAHARKAPFSPAVTPGEVKAVLVKLPACDCPPNAGEVEYALTELGIPSHCLCVNLLIKRLGKQVGNYAFNALLASLLKNAPKLKKRVPFPDYKAKSATKYAKSPYRVYEIYGISVLPGHIHLTWKYGITRQLIPKQRPERQLPACTKYFRPGALLGGKCFYRWIWIGVGWLQARTVEASVTLLYAIRNGGRCPPGMPACV